MKRALRPFEHAGCWVFNRLFPELTGRPDFPAVVFAKTQWGYGGGDHGTKAQRGEAVEKGFLAAYDQKLTPPEGTRAAFNFAMSRVE